MKTWLPYELHTHTKHSDGTHTLMELAKSAKELGYQGIALTDHSTMSGIREREGVMAATHLLIIRGMEWTTFYGHVLLLGVDQFVDWRDLSPVDLQKRTAEIHDQGGLIGVAHPFRVGSPMCTGCFWHYQVQDWSEIDYIEVWSGVFPPIQKSNQRAFQFWTDLLNQGYRITAVAGRDWHNPGRVIEPLAATYLAISETQKDVEDRVIEALKRGRVSVSLGPLLLLHVTSTTQKMKWEIGETVVLMNREEKLKIVIDLDVTARANYWELNGEALRVALNSNLGYLTEFIMKAGTPKIIFELEITGLFWIRSELYGRMQECETMIAFTNPIYFSSLLDI
ncbi:CehA/McbA family metallohydrolase [Desulfitobacterium sp.]|uniref:CehA/McbA family metallohydrolase n=1 Tax=Desulfitobacterium sp. TaxID=49981 RepID=UPI002C413592|nr:CehA/McbA family metallohydrolase [Desulfitobacterium sp.]HVJ48479.1 CehA/McbA family metallohydrolase [Desulfitobacterium sp.]